MNPSIKAYKTVCKILDITPTKITEDIPQQEGISTVIVPDRVFSHEQLDKLGEVFGKDQPYETYTNTGFLEKYTAKDLCGISSGKKYRIVRIPHEPNIPQGTVGQQKSQGIPPTQLEALVYYFTLREQGIKLTFNNTYIRQFDLAPVDFFVPYVFVLGDGRLFRDRSSVDFVGPGRALVVENSDLVPSLATSSLELQANTEALNRLTDVLERVYRV